MVQGTTKESIKVVMLAQEESRRLGHRLVCTEQLLLGVIGEETSVAARVLKLMGVTLENARIEVEKIIGRGSGCIPDNTPFSPKARRALDLAAQELKLMGGTLGDVAIEVEKMIERGSDSNDILFSPEASRALDLSLEEAEQLGHNCINVEHLLLGTLRVEDGIALRVLANLGVDPTEIRDLVLRMLSEKTAEGSTEG
jgi:ATP-dependent Clp protease ATP-binding subunit ClpC